MGTLRTTSEIVELGEESDSNLNFLKSGKKFSIQDEINQLFEAIDIRISAEMLGSSQVQRNKLWKRSMKRPIRVGSSQVSGIGISQPISLKQALRGLCISQASEMASMKRLSKSSGLHGALEARTIKRPGRTVIVEANRIGHSRNAGKADMVEISLIPEGGTSNLPEKVPISVHLCDLDNQTTDSSINSEDTTTQESEMTFEQAGPIFLPTNVGRKVSKTEFGQRRNLKLKLSSLSTRCRKKLPVLDEIIPASVEKFIESVRQNEEPITKNGSASSLLGSSSGNQVNQSGTVGPKLTKPLFRNKNLVEKRIIPDSSSGTSSSHQFNKGADKDLGPSTSEAICQTGEFGLRKASPASSTTCVSIDESSSSVDSSARKPGLIANSGKKSGSMITKADDSSTSREKGQFSQSSKSSSVCEYSSSTSFSDESNLSGSSRGGCRPHMSKDMRWEAIRRVRKQHGSFSLKHFKLLRKLGGGDIGNVYLAELTGSNCSFALKVMDNESLVIRKKMSRAQTEWEILQLLDHPFLPTLFAQFTTDKYSCFLTEYCPGGDLHVLRQKQPDKCFSEQAARFYAAEVLLALEYLHMLGIVYRDLKPENILVREDGHIMLTDFDLSLRCDPNPTLVKPLSPVPERPKRVSTNPRSESSCMDPFCLQSSWQVPCFTPRVLSASSKTRKLKSDLVTQVSPLPQLVVEPTSARSNSFVGTHEYLAPEIIKGDGHGSPVDWWTFGILLYELLYGMTPFKGTGNEETLANVVSQTLHFPESPVRSSHSRDLIRKLLRKEPGNRLGSLKGAAEIKQHPFFEGLNWALIRCAAPPELPRVCNIKSIIQEVDSRKSEKDCSSTGEHLVFDMF